MWQLFWLSFIRKDFNCKLFWLINFLHNQTRIENVCFFISALAKIDPFSNERKNKAAAENSGDVFLSIPPMSTTGPRYTSSSGIVSPCSSIHWKISISLVSEGQQQLVSLQQKVSFFIHALCTCWIGWPQLQYKFCFQKCPLNAVGMPLDVPLKPLKWP